jgi:sulfonate transport system substrate-binding protein
MHTKSTFVELNILKTLVAAMVTIAVSIGACRDAKAEAQTVRLSRQFGLGFLTVLVVLDQHLIEKNAEKLGLRDVKSTGVQLSGAAITNDALLSGSIDLAAGGVGGLLQLWDKTNGGVKGVVALNNMALVLNTNDPKIKTLKDYVGVTNHKIALPAVKVGLHAIVLQMAAQQVLGPGKQYNLDKLTLSLPHPDGYAALVSGQGEVRSHFTSQPFAYLEQHSSNHNIHQVLSSYDVLGGPHNNTLLYTTTKWATANPKLLQAVSNAVKDAESWINANSKAAAEFFKKKTKSKLGVPDIEAIMRNPKLTAYEPAPRATMRFAEFFNKIGRIKHNPTSWKDYFLDVAYNLNGS